MVTLIIYLVPLVLVIMSFALFIFVPGFNDFGANAITESLSILITVAVLDTLIKVKDKKDKTPLLCSQYIDIARFVNTFMEFWNSIHIAACKDHETAPAEVLFSNVTFEELFSRLDMTRYPNVNPKRTWFDWFAENGKRFENQAKELMDRYIGIMEPELYSCIHYIKDESRFFSLMMNITFMRDYHIQNKIPKPNNLWSFFPMVDDKFFASVLYINKWKNEQYCYLAKKGLKVIEYNLTTSSIHSFNDSRMTDEQIFTQNKVFNEWVSNHK
jgi:hypothetical protein